MIQPIGQRQKLTVEPTSSGLPVFQNEVRRSSISKGKNDPSFFGYIFDYISSFWRYFTSFLSHPSVVLSPKKLTYNSVISDERRVLLENVLNDIDPPSSKTLDRKIKLQVLHYLYLFLQQVDTLTQDKNSHEVRVWISLNYAPQTDYVVHYNPQTNPKDLAKQLIECLEKEFNKNQKEPFSFILKAHCNRLLYSSLGGPIWLDKYWVQSTISKSHTSYANENLGDGKNEKFYSYKAALQAFESNKKNVAGETNGQS